MQISLKNWNENTRNKHKNPDILLSSKLIMDPKAGVTDDTDKLRELALYIKNGWAVQTWIIYMGSSKW